MAEEKTDFEAPLALVTGVTGFIAGHVCHQLIQAGWRVRGTSRSTTGARVEMVKKLGSPRAIEIVAANLNDAQCWDKIMENVQYVFHVASPFPSKAPKDESELIEPAVNGTRNVLAAAVRARVKRFIITSSFAAVGGGHDRKLHEFDETFWSIEEKCDAYYKSKLLAEKAAWEYLRGVPEKDRIELVAINPGPLVNKNAGTSPEIMVRILGRQMPAVPDLAFGIVDVRDVARAHLRAAVDPQAPGQRFIAYTATMTMKDIALILKKEFRPLGYKPPTAQLPNCCAKMIGCCDKGVKLIVPDLSQPFKVNNEKLKRLMGQPLIDPRKTVIDMGYSVIRAGLVKDKTKDKRLSTEGLKPVAVDLRGIRPPGAPSNGEAKPDGEEKGADMEHTNGVAGVDMEKSPLVDESHRDAESNVGAAKEPYGTF